MFLHVSVILFTRGRGLASQHASQVTWPGLVYIQGEGVYIQGEGVYIQEGGGGLRPGGGGGLHPGEGGGLHPGGSASRQNGESGRYAFYWNASLLKII